MSPAIRLIPTLFALACFRPDLSKVVYACDEANPCPAGVCVQNVCQAADAGTTGADLAGSSGADAGSKTGCTDGGGTLFGAAWACSGAFGVGQARGLCAAGWHVCTDMTGIDLAACNMKPSFWAADVPASRQSGNSYVCGPTVVYDRLFFGCGSANHVRSYLAATCSGLTMFVDCSLMTMYWDCTAFHSLNQTVNKVASDGVLCCKN